MSCRDKSNTSDQKKAVCFQENISKKSKEEQVSSTVDISAITMKMQNQNDLTEQDYRTICNFLFENNDESKSEEAGYNLFNYFKRNKQRNDALVAYLNKNNAKYIEQVLGNLVRIMCIDIGEENYTYNAFLGDFDLFKNSGAARKAFDECMSNQVE